MIPLAITSTAGWVRRLGFVRWQRLHRLIYFSALAGVIHYYWLVKSDVRLPLMYGAILAVLMLIPVCSLAQKAAQSAGWRAVTTPNTASLRDWFCPNRCAHRKFPAASGSPCWTHLP